NDRTRTAAGRTRPWAARLPVLRCTSSRRQSFLSSLWLRLRLGRDALLDGLSQERRVVHRRRPALRVATVGARCATGAAVAGEPARDVVSGVATRSRVAADA